MQACVRACKRVCACVRARTCVRARMPNAQGIEPVKIESFMERLMRSPAVAVLGSTCGGSERVMYTQLALLEASRNWLLEGYTDEGLPDACY